MYRQIAEELREQIESGMLAPGSQLPTELELRERYTASRNTIRDALRWLTIRGLITARAGQGTFVSQRRDPFITTLSWTAPGPGYGSDVEQIRPASATAPKVEVQTAGRRMGAMLWLSEEAEVVSRQQLRYVDDVLWSLQTAFYPMDLVTRGAVRLLGATDIEMGATAYLKEALGLVEGGHQDLIRVGSPSGEEARLFKLPDDGSISVITVLRTSYTTGDQDQIPFRVTVTVFPSDRNELRVTSGEIPTRTREEWDSVEP